MKIVMFFSVVLIILGYLVKLFLIFFSNKKMGTLSGFDIAKKLTNEYDSINVIKINNKFSYYDIKRRVIKLSATSYDNKNLGLVTISAINSGISLAQSKKNKSIEFFSSFLNNLNILYFLPIIALVINSISVSIIDAKISIVLIFLLVLIMYFYMDILLSASDSVRLKLKKNNDISHDEKLNISNLMNKFIVADYFLFYGEIAILAKMVLILMGK